MSENSYQGQIENQGEESGQIAENAVGMHPLGNEFGRNFQPSVPVTTESAFTPQEDHTNVSKKGPHIVMTKSTGEVKEFKPDQINDFGKADTWFEVLNYLGRDSV